MLKFRSFDFHKDICIFHNSQTKLLGCVRSGYETTMALAYHPTHIPLPSSYCFKIVQNGDDT